MGIKSHFWNSHFQTMVFFSDFMDFSDGMILLLGEYHEKETPNRCV
jgi:hypothetical protein